MPSTPQGEIYEQNRGKGGGDLGKKKSMRKKINEGTVNGVRNKHKKKKTKNGEFR